MKVLYLENIKFNTFSDLLARTGIVFEYFLSQNKKVYINDSLYSNYIFYNARLSNDRYNQAKIYKLLNYYNNSEDYIKDNCFSYSNAKFTGSVREHSDYFKSKVLNSLTDLLSKLKTKYIVLAYNKIILIMLIVKHLIIKLNLRNFKIFYPNKVIYEQKKYNLMH
ncbi:hypothetical protein ATZ36_08685 [Candidatus Endomicrobiellum trichonymphae]|uniref:Uncharacterized protein n=1 Tax=Endomicrobium trichonymphae TaxID=1408204 RepID=A0A1E5IGE7_ENDTX|nr:hypothetical protein ATZ36_08685 [Candidatus Endomicrobium trichonymphae]